MRYHTPNSFEDAARLAAQAQGVVRFLAGGTDVLVQLRTGGVTPDDLIDIKHIPGAGDIAQTPEGGWRIGAAVSGAEMGEHAGLRGDWPGVVEAMELVGSTQVQGRATLAGNLCNASPAADSVPALVAAGAVASVIGPDGAREVAVAEIPAGPGATTLAKGELIAAITLPPRGVGGADAYLRFIPRTEMDIAVVGCGVSLTLEGETITAARIALGAVGPKVMEVPEAARALIGATWGADVRAKVEAAARAAATPITDKRATAEFRKDIAGVLAGRAVQIAHDRAKGEAQ